MKLRIYVEGPFGSLSRGDRGAGREPWPSDKGCARCCSEGSRSVTRDSFIRIYRCTGYRRMVSMGNNSLKGEGIRSVRAEARLGRD